MNHFAWPFRAVLFLLPFLSQSVASADDQAAPPEVNRQATLEKDVTQGALRVVGKDGSVVECPLKHTDVQADVSGFITRAKVTQTFANPSKEKVEAVYVFPLPHEAAVDAMTMTVGERKIVGVIKRRAEARQIYEQALLAGNTAALLEQERPNIFTQSVGNIDPGQEVRIEISYVDMLRYDMGTYEFQFPMVVGPRYIPGGAISSPQDVPANLQGKVSPPIANTDRVPDAQRISPPVLKPGVRNGHDISLTIALDAGVPIQNLVVANHRAEVSRDGDRKAKIVLARDDSMPNKDFVVRYDVAGKAPAMAVLSHTGNHSGDARNLGNGYFMLMIQPQDDERLRKSPPREIVFLVDVSGSMSGTPTAKVVETMQHMLRLCREKDTVQVITFASHAAKLFEKPVPVNQENIERALGFTAGLQGSGGTEMLKGVKLAIDEPIDEKRLRIVVMLTDGYIGNEAEIIEHVGKNCGDQVRFWCVGIGQAPNMFLVDGVAKQGGGMGKQLGFNDDSANLSQEIMNRIQRAQLAKVKIDWGTNRVAETYPARIPELWAGRPIVVFGRYKDGGQPGTITVSGTIEGESTSWPLEVSLPANEAAHDVLAAVWARRKVEDLMQQAYYQQSPSVEEEVTAISLDYRLMSQYTSFVAVDEKDVSKTTVPATPPRRMLVPVPLPEGTRWEGFFGESLESELADGVTFEKAFGQPVRLNEASRFSIMPLSKDRSETWRRKSLPGMPGGTRSVESLARRTDSYRAAAPSPRFRLFNGASTSPALGASARVASGKGFGGRNYSYSQSLSTEEAKPRTLSLAVKESAVDELKQLDGRDALSPLWASMQAGAQPLLEKAREALKSGREKQTKGQLADARELLGRACFLATAVANSGLHDEGIADAAMTALEGIHTMQTREWKQALPALDKRLDMVIRNKSLAEAIALVAEAAGTKIEVIAGSTEDSAMLLGRPARVTYLDLRQATVAEALDWMLVPVRLTWRPANGNTGIVVATDRRLGGWSAWVYDVSMLITPAADELSQLPDEAQRQAATIKAASDFLALLAPQDRGNAARLTAWFAPGELLVIGMPAEHSAAAKLIADLADPAAKLNGAAATLHATTLKRVKPRLPIRDKRLAVQAMTEVAEVHEELGWRLLSAALAGRVDDESRTELEIAWSRSETDKLLKGDGTAIALRSAWLVQEASRLVPKDKELAKLSTVAVQKTRQAAETAVAAFESKPTDPNAIAAALYGALNLRHDSRLVEKLAVNLENAGKEPAAVTARLCAAVLKPNTDAARQTLVDLSRSGVQGSDAVVVLAWACRRAGTEVWSEFRSHAMDLLGSQPLPGDVVILINRLNGANVDELTAR